MRLILIAFVICTACQSGKIPCPEIKFAKIKESSVGKRGFYAPAAPSKVYASNKAVAHSESKRKVDLDRLRANRVTGKEMLEHYGTVEEWDCPSPEGKKRYSKVAKENIRKNEKKMREHLKSKNGADSVALIVPGARIK